MIIMTMMILTMMILNTNPDKKPKDDPNQNNIIDHNVDKTNHYAEQDY